MARVRPKTPKRAMLFPAQCRDDPGARSRRDRGELPQTAAADRDRHERHAGPHCALRRQAFGQRLPLAAAPQHVENFVQNLAHVDRALAAAVLGQWDSTTPHSAPVRSWDNENRCGPPQCDVDASTTDAPPRESSANTELQPNHQTQQLPGSAPNTNELV